MLIASSDQTDSIVEETKRGVGGGRNTCLYIPHPRRLYLELYLEAAGLGLSQLARRMTAEVLECQPQFLLPGRSQLRV